MNTINRNKIAEKADMIVCGYAFSHKEDGNVSIVSLHAPYHASIMTPSGQIIETNMDDIEISIVVKLWNRNKKLLEEAYA